DRGWAEGDGEALRLALRSRDPFADAAALDEFAELAFVVYGALVHGEPLPAPPIGAEPLAHDAQDAARAPPALPDPTRHSPAPRARVHGEPLPAPRLGADPLADDAEDAA